MSFDSMLKDTLVIERAAAGAVDGYGQPAQTWATLATVPGLVRSKSVKEMALTSQGGAVVANHTIYLNVRDVTAKDRVKLSPDDGRIFELTGVRNRMGHHLELDANVVI